MLVPGALEANKATGKTQSLRISNITPTTALGKTLRETRKLEETLIRTSQAKLRLATINVVTLVGGSAEVAETVGRRVDVAALQKVRFRNEGVKTLKGGDVNADCIGKVKAQRARRCWIDGEM